MTLDWFIFPRLSYSYLTSLVLVAFTTDRSTAVTVFVWLCVLLLSVYILLFVWNIVTVFCLSIIAFDHVTYRI